MKLLSICIPTYNRINELNKLAAEFLIPAMREYGHLLEVVICDNSNEAEAHKNRAVCKGWARYTWNTTNIGFGGNVLKCVSLAEGEYLWVMPDNDDVDWAGFSSLMKELEKKVFDVYFVPYSSNNIFGRTSINYYAEIHHIGNRVRDMFKTKDFLPFILLSSAVVRKNKNWTSNEVPGPLRDNTFVQIPALVPQLDFDATFTILDYPIILYNVEYNGRFNPLKTFMDITLIIEWLGDKFDCQGRTRILREYRQLLLSLIADAAGIYRVHEADKVKWRALRMLKKYWSIKAFFLALVCLLPKTLRGFIWRVAMCYTDARVETKDFRGMISRLQENYRKLSTHRM